MLDSINTNLSSLSNPLSAYKKTLAEKKSFFDEINDKFKTKESSGDEILDMLYKRLEDLYKMLAQINKQIQNAPDNETKLQLLSQAQNINAQILETMGQIMKRLKVLTKGG